MKTYRVQCTGDKIGLIEMVPKSQTISEIEKEMQVFPAVICKLQFYVIFLGICSCKVA